LRATGRGPRATDKRAEPADGLGELDLLVPHQERGSIAADPAGPAPPTLLVHRERRVVVVVERATPRRTPPIPLDRLAQRIPHDRFQVDA
jgi:hypothetical protein